MPLRQWGAAMANALTRNGLALEFARHRAADRRRRTAVPEPPGPGRVRLLSGRSGRLRPRTDYDTVAVWGLVRPRRQATDPDSGPDCGRAERKTRQSRAARLFHANGTADRNAMHAL